MANHPGFDEVMIINPSEPNDVRGVRLMQFYPGQPSGVGYYGEAPDPLGYYAEAPQPFAGYYAQAPQFYGQYAEAPEPYGYYGGYYGEAPEPYGYYAEAPEPFAGYYGEAPQPYGYYAEAPEPYGYYGEGPEQFAGQYAEAQEPLAAYSESPGAYGQYAENAPLEGSYGEMPEMPGYAEADYPGVSYYGDPYLAGYVRAQRPAYNPGCPIPTNVAGFAESPLEGVDGYVKPATVNAACDQVVPQPNAAASASDYFRPLW